ncbi:helix-turn-helix domain-containing protein [Novosphingobium humi]|uniref:Helix-turn-helix domain-containing protein n=1 Tax=Novosphingobium humi TaxID=2282397 RepID=A0ABY7TRV1_9SPHN|nr:helix-turn-helix domain-containing protein [Novosphingobium humi]WCT75935.1 helix-turn-helix domain-containing protein [Novosphingobium humi]
MTGSTYTDRAGVDYVIKKTGLSRRTVQSMAARGLIPGAAKLGKLWTFDRSKLGKWISDKERECLSRQISSSGAVFSMPAFKLAASKSGTPLRQRIAERRSAG